MNTKCIYYELSTFPSRAASHYIHTLTHMHIWTRLFLISISFVFNFQSHWIATKHRPLNHFVWACVSFKYIFMPCIISRGVVPLYTSAFFFFFFVPSFMFPLIIFISRFQFLICYVSIHSESECKHVCTCTRIKCGWYMRGVAWHGNVQQWRRRWQQCITHNTIFQTENVNKKTNTNNSNTIEMITKCKAK